MKRGKLDTNNILHLKKCIDNNDLEALRENKKRDNTNT
jgi:hypothetical protein